jgi:hypothetical protein
MIPGLMTKLSESTVASTTTIEVTSDLVRLTGSTAIATIKSHLKDQAGIIGIVCIDGTIATTTAGNIALVVTMPQSKVCWFAYSKKDGLWYPGAIS